MSIQSVFVILAVIQGCFVLGFTAYIFWYYFPKKRHQVSDKMRWHILFVSISYILLTLATIITASTYTYSWGDTWYWIVSIAYLFGDVSLVFVFRSAVKKEKYEHHFKNLTDKNT